MSSETHPWHLDEALALRYADGPMPGALAASVEQHLVRCAPCRALLRPVVPEERRSAVWTAVLERVQAPPMTLAERLLRRVGVDDATSRLVAVTPLLRTSWLAGTVLVLVLTLLATHASESSAALFLLLAPVLPVVGVALTFGPAADPSHEMAAAAPYSPTRLLAVRTAVVVTSTFLPAGVAAVLLPTQPWTAIAWLLPALALTVGTLALSTRMAPHVAASGLAIGWFSTVAYGAARHDPHLAAAPGVQLASLALMALSAAVLLVHRHDLAEILRRVP